MSAGAIHFDSIGAAAFPGGPVAVRPGTEFDFAAMLSIASALNSHADIQEPAAKAEAFRTGAVHNHLRTTTISFTDGTSETRIEAVEDEFVQAPTPLFVPVPQGPRIVIKEPSDLEPELGLNNRTEPSERWRNPMARRPTAFWTQQSPDAQQSPMAAQHALECDDKKIGKRIDTLV